jgi:hypothetical protein
MEIEAAGIETAEIDRPCLEINGKISCYEPKPAPEAKCVKIGSLPFCEATIKGTKIDTTFQKEARKVMNSMLYPKIHTDEAKHVERMIVEFTVGFISAALVFTVSLYIKDAVDFILAFFMDGTVTFISLVIIIAVLTIVSMVLSFVEYRTTRSLERTNLFETLADKDLVEILDEVANDS